jgi:hypothetical protein
MEMYAGTKAAREEAAVVMAAAGYPGSDASPLLRVKVLSSGAEHLVSAAMLKALPQRAFLPGEPVRRAMWSGAEEDAEVRGRCCGVRPAVMHCASHDARDHPLACALISARLLLCARATGHAHRTDAVATRCCCAGGARGQREARDHPPEEQRRHLHLRRIPPAPHDARAGHARAG